MAKRVTGRHVATYIGSAYILSSFWSTKKWAEQKETKTANMDTKRVVNPTKSFPGRYLAKSFSLFLDVRMARNMIVEVIEEQRATSDEIAKR